MTPLPPTLSPTPEPNGPAAAAPGRRGPTVVAAAVAVLVFTWSFVAHRFFCDDAYILFRYASNVMAGRGPVWNAPPFLPVEGYTSPLWLLLLVLAWCFGVGPEIASQIQGWAFGAATLLCLAAVGHRFRGTAGRLLLWAMLLGTATNRTFVLWCSSGLETSSHVFAWTAWCAAAVWLARAPGPRALVACAAAATLGALSRPDGYLLPPATAVLGLWLVWQRRASVARSIAACTPLLAVAAHLLWRRAYYGEWLPNTYYAKVVVPHPDLGWRYTACYAVEHGAWLLPLLLLVWIVRPVRTPRDLAWADAERPTAGLRAHALARALPVVVAAGTALFHLGYYTLIVGGDHFEYRAFAHFVPLQFLAAAALLAATSLPALPRVGAAAAMAVFGQVGWLHAAWIGEHMHQSFRAVSPAVPTLLRPLARAYDGWHAWLRLRAVAIRAESHAMFCQKQVERCPAREVGARLGPAADGLPVIEHYAVGMPGWTLPNVAVIDRHGLNDWVVARTPPVDKPLLPEDMMRGAAAAFDRDHDGRIDRDELTAAFVVVLPAYAAPEHAEDRDFMVELYWLAHCSDGVAMTVDDFVGMRRSYAAVSMAHERLPPPGYVEGFRQNVWVRLGRADHEPRQQPLGPDDVVAWEAEWRRRIREQRR